MTFARRGNRSLLLLWLLVTLSLVVANPGVADAAPGDSYRVVRVDDRSVLEHRDAMLHRWRDRVPAASVARDGLDLAVAIAESGAKLSLTRISMPEAQDIVERVPLADDGTVVVRAVGVHGTSAIVLDYYTNNDDESLSRIIVNHMAYGIGVAGDVVELARVDITHHDGRVTASHRDTTGGSETVVTAADQACEDCTAVEVGTGLATGGACIALAALGPLGIGGSLLCLAIGTVATTGAGAACTIQACRGGWPEVIVNCGTNTFSCQVTATVYSSAALSPAQMNTVVDLYWIKEDGNCPDCIPNDFAWDQRSFSLRSHGSLGAVYKYEHSVTFQAGSLIRQYVTSCAQQARAIHNSVHGRATMQTAKLTSGTC